MTRDHTKALDDLIAAVEKGNVIATNAKTNCECFGWKFPDVRIGWLLEAELGSLDAAKALHEALLPEWTWTRWPQGDFEVRKGVGKFYIGASFDPARAWLIAILKAYRSTLSS